MFALTVKQPWAQAIARFSKNVENRSRRPPAHLLGQRIAIHVSQARDAWDDFVDTVPDPHLGTLYAWAIKTRTAQGAPGAGKIIATARLVAAVKRGVDGGMIVVAGELSLDQLLEIDLSPWWVADQVGWILDDIRVLREPVGPIRGQVMAFALSPEIEAAVLVQESK